MYLDWAFITLPSTVTSAATSIPFAVPINPSFGVNLTSPSVSIVYVPCSVTTVLDFWPVAGSTSW